MPVSSSQDPQAGREKGWSAAFAFWSTTPRHALWDLVSSKGLSDPKVPTFCDNTCDSFIHSQSKLPLNSFLKPGIVLGEKDTGVSGSYNDLPSFLGVVVYHFTLSSGERKPEGTQAENRLLNGSVSKGLSGRPCPFSCSMHPTHSPAPSV